MKKQPLTFTVCSCTSQLAVTFIVWVDEGHRAFTIVVTHHLATQFNDCH